MKTSVVKNLTTALVVIALSASIFAVQAKKNDFFCKFKNNTDQQIEIKVGIDRKKDNKVASIILDKNKEGSLYVTCQNKFLAGKDCEVDIKSTSEHYNNDNSFNFAYYKDSCKNGDTLKVSVKGKGTVTLYKIEK